MAATNIKDVLELLRTKVHGADSSTSLDELNNMVKAAQIAHTPMIRHYDSDGSLPTATTTEQRLAFITSTGSIKMNNGRRWETTSATHTPTPPPWQPGFNDIAGYATGGTGNTDTIQKWSHTSDGDATDIGDLAVARRGNTGASNSTTGWVLGSIQASQISPSFNRVDKFPFATETGAAAGDITNTGSRRSGVAMTETAGYIMGGQAPAAVSRIEKYTYASESSVTITAALSSTNSLFASASSTVNGYAMGGQPFDGVRGTRIEKFPFASEDTVTDIANLLQSVNKVSGVGDTTHGYALGGQLGPPSYTHQNVIQKFPFAAEDDATDVADLTSGRYFTTNSAGDQSSTHGYGVGGAYPYSDTVDKFSFASSSNATDVGNLLSAAMDHGNHSN